MDIVEGYAELGGCLEALGLVFSGGAGNNFAQGGMGDLVERERCCALLLKDGFDRAGEGAAAGGELEEEDAEGVNVGALVLLLKGAVGQLRGGILGLADKGGRRQHAEARLSG